MGCGLVLEKLELDLHQGHYLGNFLLSQMPEQELQQLCWPSEGRGKHFKYLCLEDLDHFDLGHFYLKN